MKTFPLLEAFMYFFNLWLVFIIVHLGNKYVVVDIITRFIHEPGALAWLTLSVLFGIFGWVAKRRWIRFIGNVSTTVWWGTVWMLYMITIKTIISLAFSIYLLPLVVSITVMTQLYQRLGSRLRARDPFK